MKRGFPPFTAAALLLVAFARPAGAVPAPSDSALSEWRAAIASGSRLRLSTPAGRFEPLRVRLDSAGVRYDALSPSAFVVFEAPADRAKLVEWQQADAVELSHRSGATHGMVVGLLTGFLTSEALTLVLDAAIKNQTGFRGPTSAQSAPFVAASTAVCGAIGALIGLSSSHWSRVAP